MKKCSKRQNGFTLVEILCAVVILLVIGFIFVYHMNNRHEDKGSSVTMVTSIDDKEFDKKFGFSSALGSTSFAPRVEEVNTNGTVSSETANTNEGGHVYSGETKVNLKF